MNSNIKGALIHLGRIKDRNIGLNNTELAIFLANSHESDLYRALVLLFNEVDSVGPRYSYAFICAIADIREIKARNGGLINGNISFVAKKHKIKVKDLRVVLQDEGIIK